MFGKVTVQLKLVEGDSAGTVTAFYVSKNIFYLHLLYFNLDYLFKYLHMLFISISSIVDKQRMEIIIIWITVANALRVKKEK